MAHRGQAPGKNRPTADAGIKRRVWRESPLALPPTGNPPESPQLRALSQRSALRSIIVTTIMRHVPSRRFSREKSAVVNRTSRSREAR